MKLKNAAKYFDTCPVYDGYTGNLLFKVQASTFMEAAAEGSVSVRRTISLAPELTTPTHSVILLLGDRYVLGEENFDEWSGEAVRKTCWTRKVSDSFAVSTPNGVLSYTVSFNAYGQKRQLKETTLLDSSRMETYWEVSLSASITVAAGSFLKSNSIYYRVRNTYLDVDGFLTCTVDQLQHSPFSIGAVTGKVYDPVTDSYVGTSSAVQCLPLDYKICFNKQTQSDFSVAPGDMCFLLPGSLSLKTGATFTVSSGNLEGSWRALNVVKELDAWLVHVRRA